MKNAIRVLGRRTIDMRTATGKWLTARCEEYARDLGGDEALSQQQRTVIRLVVFDELVLQSGQAWLMRQDALVSARRRAFLPVVRELTALGESIARKLSMLGLEKKVREVTLDDWLEQRAAEKAKDQEPPPVGDGGGGDADGDS